MVANWTAERFGRLPRLYLEATEDRSVVLAVQRKMQALVPGAQVVSLPCGHVPQVVQTAAVLKPCWRLPVDGSREPQAAPCFTYSAPYIALTKVRSNAFCQSRSAGRVPAATISSKKPFQRRWS
ncbi:hypothetical protein ULG90_16525 [Halopseudomonas pachastrellae]|nr:hypothetical protein ULG90_16525 [Halopseudomonas pachastrellae]